MSEDGTTARAQPGSMFGHGGARVTLSAVSRAREASTLAPAVADDCEVLHLAELLDVLRARLDLEPAFDDDTLLASLVEVARSGDRTERWRAAFNSTLGQWLALRGRDLNTTLSIIIATLPPARS